MASEHPGVSGVTMKVDYGEFTRTPKSFIRAHSWSRLVIPGPIRAFLEFLADLGSRAGNFRFRHDPPILIPMPL